MSGTKHLTFHLPWLCNLKLNLLLAHQPETDNESVNSGCSESPSDSSCASPVGKARIFRNLDTPVPAGIRCPIMTFSFRPTSRSCLPMTEALVSTLVVCWNEAAEMKLSVDRDAFVIPCKIDSAVAGCPSFSTTWRFARLKVVRSTSSSSRNSVSPGFSILPYSASVAQ